MGMFKASLAKTEAETKNIEAQTLNTEAQTVKTQAESKLIGLQAEYYPRLTEAQITEINASVSKLQAEVPYLRASASKASAEVGFVNAQKLLTEKNTSWIDALNDMKVKQGNAEALRNAAETAWTQFQHAYAAAYKHTIPSGGITALLSYLESTLQVDNEVFNAFLDAIRSQGSVSVDVTQYEMPGTEVPHSGTVPFHVKND